MLENHRGHLWLNKCLVAACLSGVCLLFSSNAFAQVTGSGPGFVIPDNDPNGVTSTITIADDFIITDAEFSLEFGPADSHTWVGDLIVQVTSPAGTTVDLFNRLGGGLGDTSDLGPNAVYTFSDDGEDFAAAADATGALDTIAGGDYFATDANGDFVSLAAAFGSESTLGDWTFFVSDNLIEQTGSVTGVSLFLTVNAIPEPGSLALLGMMAVGCIARRRRT